MEQSRNEKEFVRIRAVEIFVICCGEGTKGGESLNSCLEETVVTSTLEAHEWEWDI